jgi:hypothetical protein
MIVLMRIGFQTPWRELPPGWRWVGWGVTASTLAVPVVVTVFRSGLGAGSILRGMVLGLPALGLAMLVLLGRGQRLRLILNLVAGALILLLMMASRWFEGGLWLALGLLLQIPVARWWVAVPWLAVPIYCSRLWTPVLWQGELVPIQREIKLLHRAAQRRQESGKSLVIRSKAEWEDFLADARAGTGREEVDALIPVDFGRFMVILCPLEWGPPLKPWRREVRRCGQEFRCVRAFEDVWCERGMLCSCVYYSVDFALVVERSALPVAFPAPVYVRRLML